jgi:outer membrane immunogenic protein
MKKLLLSAIATIAIAAPALAADLPARTYSKAPVVVAPAVYDWTGFYVGGTLGGAWGTFDPSTSTVFSPTGYFNATSVPVVNAAGSQSIKPSGFTGGLEAGYNWQVSNIVVGIEGDFQSFRLRGSSSGSGVFPCCAPSSFTIASSASTNWLATARGRIGFAADKWLFFATGGAAFTDLNGTSAYTDNCFAVPACGGGPGGPLTTEAVSLSSTKVGYAAGAGVEAGLWGNWTLKAEYLYVDFGTITGTGRITAPPVVLVAGSNNNPFTHSFDLKANIARVGLNYRFGGPVVAKY